MSEKAKDIYQAMNLVMAEVGYVRKTKSPNLNYTYAGESDLIRAIRPAMVEQGIVIHPSGVEQIHQDQYTTRNGAVMNRTTVVMVYRFAHADSGTFIDVPVTGEGSDTGDKSANKALTGAYKYALRQALLIETGDDPDQYPSDNDPRDWKGQQDREEHRPKPPATNGNGKPKMMSAAKYKEWLTLEHKFKNVQHTQETMKLLGFWPTPSTPEERKRCSEALAAYRGLRDSNGLSQDEALAALADEEVENG